MTDINEIAERAVSFLKSSAGGRLGNTKLRSLLDVTEAAYNKVKDRLLADGTCSAGRGRGGSMILMDVRSDDATVEESSENISTNPIQHINDMPRASAPYKVEGRDYGSEDNDDIVKVFEHRPHNNRSEYCLEIFECLKQRRLTYPGIRNHRSMVDQAIRQQAQIHHGVMTDIHDSANKVLEGEGLAIDPNVGLIRWHGGI